MQTEKPASGSTVGHESLRHYLHGIKPEWCPIDPSQDAAHQLQSWFLWPPNAFLLTSRLLEDTGIYRLPVVQTCAKAWPPADWARSIHVRVKEWREWIRSSPETLPPEWIRDCIRALVGGLERPMCDLFDWQSPPQDGGREDKATVISLCRELLALHATADSFSDGFGIPSGYSNKHEANAHERAMVTYLANSLLISTGSLATLSRFHGIVLPKMRTPQVGMTLRSLSMHLTYHRTDVEVLWRSLPWINRDENTINLLVVPFPYEIRPDAFRALPHPNFAQAQGKVRYFKYSPPIDANAEPASIFDPEAVLAYIREAEKHVRKVNLLVFPEVALTKEQLRSLQALLAARGDPQAPLVIAGVGGEVDGEPGTHALATNKVVLSTYFAGKWYDIEQAKHHRWRVDGKQIEQYQIAGVLAGTQLWWEAIDLPKRQVCCLAPNQWLALCPLICEDLARQEPIYDVIRGIGPTLLTAILLDGPQLKSRWSARYASVLADDPGTAVLTTTSFGMAKRSLIPDTGKPPEATAPSKVALWRDQKTGFREIEMTQDHGAIVITISAEFLTEYTADGRDDGGAASSFVLHSHHTLPRYRGARKPTEVSTGQLTAGDTLDMIELSIFTHLVDSALDHPMDVVEEMCALALGARLDSDVVPRLDDVIKITRQGRLRAEKISNAKEVRPDMKYAVACFRSAMRDVDHGPERHARLIDAATGLFERVAPSTSTQLKANEVVRVHQMVGRSILWAIHMRLDWRRRLGTLQHAESQQLDTIEKLLSH